jgi:CubicO group peptidase (beta-lactamase class C family)
MPIVRRVGSVVLALGIVAGCSSHPGPPAGSADPAEADTVMRVVHDFMAQAHLKAVIVRVTVDGKEIVTQAVGDSITGVPATTDMHFGNDAFNNLFYANPFRQWTTQHILAQISSRPLLYDPGTNWNYAHTNYVLLGLALEKATGQDMPTLLQNEVLGPLGLKATANSDTPAIPQPALHAFSSERRQFLKIPAGTPFYEESTSTAVGIGSGRLLSPDSYKKMVSTELRGKTHAQSDCPTICFEQNDGYTYGLGIVISGDWLMQNPMMAGYAALEAYLPAQKAAVAVAVTYAPEAFDGQGNYSNQADILFREIGAVVAPNNAPPMPPGR